MKLVHLFGSGLGSDLLDNDQGFQAIKWIENKSDFRYCIVLDLEEVSRGNTLQEVLNEKNKSRNHFLKLIQQGNEENKFAGIIIRINPTSDYQEYTKDCELFYKLGFLKDSLKGVYVPDFEDANELEQIAKDLGIPPYKIMPIIETAKGHQNLYTICSKLVAVSQGKDVYIIGSGDAYHRFLDRAKDSAKESDVDKIKLTPDTLLGKDVASQSAYEETVKQIGVMDNLKAKNLHLMLATSTYIGPDAGDITYASIHEFNKYKEVGSYIGNNIGKVLIDPSQLFLSQTLKDNLLGGKPSINAPVEHKLTESEVIQTYLYCKIHKLKPIINDYIILDAQFYIALFKEFKKLGINDTVKKYNELEIYMGENSSLLLEDIFHQFENDIINYKDM